MKVGIIAAMEEELSLLLDNLKNTATVTFGQFTYHTGFINGVEVALFQSGIGKVNAAVGTTLLLDKFMPDCLINTGVAGGLTDEVHVGDVVVSSEVCHYDADATAFEYKIGQVPQMPEAYKADGLLSILAQRAGKVCSEIAIHHGSILSGDSFICTSQQIEYLEKNFPGAMAVEMEGAAVAQTTFLFNVPFVLIRSISDKVREKGNTVTYAKCMEKAAENSSKIVVSIINELLNLK